MTFFAPKLHPFDKIFGEKGPNFIKTNGVISN